VPSRRKLARQMCNPRAIFGHLSSTACDQQSNAATPIHKKCNPDLSFGPLSDTTSSSLTSLAIIKRRLKQDYLSQEKLHALGCETTLLINQRQHAIHPLNLSLVKDLLRNTPCLDPVSKSSYIRFSAP
jgi:hypothetical protein